MTIGIDSYYSDAKNEIQSETTFEITSLVYPKKAVAQTVNKQEPQSVVPLSKTIDLDSLPLVLAW